MYYICREENGGEWQEILRRPNSAEQEKLKYYSERILATIEKTFNILKGHHFEMDNKVITAPPRVKQDSFSKNIVLLSFEVRFKECSGLFSIVLSNKLIQFLMLTQEIPYRETDCIKGQLNEGCFNCRLLLNYIKDNPKIFKDRSR